MFSSKPKFEPGVPFEVQRVYDLLTPKPKELKTNASQRRFVSEGEVGVFNHKERRTKKRYMFLFNDVLLITKKEGKKSYWLKIFIGLTPNLRIEDVPDSATKYKVEFRIYALKKTIILFTQTESEKLRWLKLIRECISARSSGSGDSPSAGFSPADAVSYAVEETPAYKDEDIQISGDIGKIEIPGVGGSYGGNESDSDEFVPDYGSREAPMPQQPPATPASTPVAPSALDDFDSIANRGQAPSIPARPSAPPAGAFDPFADSQPLQPDPFMPSSGAVLQPVPVNTAPATYTSPAPAGGSFGFDALKSLDQHQGLPQQQPEQMFSQGFDPNLSIEEQMQRLSMGSPYYRGN